MSAAYERGRREGPKGKQNPYNEGTSDYYEWEEGSEDASERNRRPKRHNKWEDFE